MMTSDDSLRYFSFFDLTALQGVLCLNPAHLKYSKDQTLTQNTQNSQSMLEYLDHAEILHNFNFLVLATAPINAPSACQMR